MPELFNVLPPDNALALLQQHFYPKVSYETIATSDALGRVLGESLTAPSDLPAFPRSSMDGYAVRAKDTFGASESLPTYLTVVGEILMGKVSALTINMGQAARVHTGGMLAEGADAVVMVENTQVVDNNSIEVVRSTAPGENVVQVGEDIKSENLLLTQGHVLRPQDIGGLTALGFTEINVARRPKVAIISTGDEVVAPEITPKMGQIRDVNTYTISALTAQAGGIAIPMGVVPDERIALQKTAQQGLEEGDILVISAGSSVSSRDITAEVIANLGDPGILLHGISIKPGKPTIVALVGEKPVFGLPGNPVSAMIVFDLLVRPAIYWLSGCRTMPTVQTVRAKITRDIPSAAGREDYLPVRLTTSRGQTWADPVFGKSNLIYTLVHANGLLQIPLDKSGIYANEEVEIRMY